MIMMDAFDWSRLGDITEGRKNMGGNMPVAVYRLLQYTIHDELTARFGKDEANSIIRSAGYRAGLAFGRNMVTQRDTFQNFVADLQQKLKEFSIGIFRIEQADMKKLKFVVTVSEDLDCSGLPVVGETVCVYDEGFLAGILYDYLQMEFEVIEIDCWATGARTCRFSAEPVQSA